MPFRIACSIETATSRLIVPFLKPRRDSTTGSAFIYVGYSTVFPTYKRQRLSTLLRPSKGLLTSSLLNVSMATYPRVIRFIDFDIEDGV